jgi:hypothetical protein
MKRSVEREYYNPEIQGMGFASCRDGLRRRDEKSGEGDGEEDDEEDGEDYRKEP